MANRVGAYFAVFLAIGILSLAVSGCAAIKRIFGYSDHDRTGQKDTRPAYDCVSAFVEGNRAYRRYKRMPVLDTSPFRMAAEYYKSYLQHCPGHGYEDDALYSLGNCYFFLGEYEQSSYYYGALAQRFPYSDYNNDSWCSKEAAFLRECQHDPAMEHYRRANLYELHILRNAALDEYRIAVQMASCESIKQECMDRIHDLNRYR